MGRLKKNLFAICVTFEMWQKHKNLLLELMWKIVEKELSFPSGQLPNLGFNKNRIKGESS